MGIHQQLMGVDTKTHNQTLGRARKPLIREGVRKDYRSQRSQVHRENMAHRAKKGGLIGAHGNLRNKHRPCMGLS